jgi:hypothetical protein
MRSWAMFSTGSAHPQPTRRVRCSPPTPDQIQLLTVARTVSRARTIQTCRTLQSSIAGTASVCHARRDGPTRTGL